MILFVFLTEVPSDPRRRLIRILRTETDTLIHGDVIFRAQIRKYSESRKRERNRITDEMPVRVVQSEVTPPLPVNSKQVRKSP